MDNICHLVTLNDDLLIYITRYLDYSTCLLLFCTCRRFRDLADDDFWKHQIIARLSMTNLAPLRPNKTYKEKYLLLATEKGEYNPGSERYISLQQLSFKFLNIPPLCRNYFISKFKLSTKNNALCSAAKGGNMEAVQLLISKHANNYARAMANAAHGGYMEIVLLMIKFGATGYDYALTQAAEGGCIKMVNFMLSKGANEFGDAMEFAAYRGHREIVELLLNKSRIRLLENIPLCTEIYRDAAFAAARGGHMDIVEFILRKQNINGYGPTFEMEDYEQIMTEAAYFGHINIVELMLSKGINDINSAMLQAAHGGRINIVRSMLRLGANEYNETMAAAAGGGHMDIIQLMLDRGANNYNETCKKAIQTKNYENIRQLIGNHINSEV